jgi:hypothetical protein
LKNPFPHRKKTHTITPNTRKPSHTAVRRITELFRHTQIRTAFRTQNTVQNILKLHTQRDKYGRSGIYQMKYLNCPLKYIGQTGRTLSIRCKEHIQAIRNNISNSGYSNHILNSGHTHGTITDTMDIIKAGRKGKHFNTLEKY